MSSGGTGLPTDISPVKITGWVRLLFKANPESHRPGRLQGAKLARIYSPGGRISLSKNNTTSSPAISESIPA